MTRSSRHKSSSKHGSSRDGRDYSESERDSSFKDRKGGGKEEGSGGGGAGGSRISKDSGEKRKFVDVKEIKEAYASVNGEYIEECSSLSKRPRERVEESGEDRWNGGGGEVERGDGTRKSGKEKERVAESKSKRRDDGVGGESEELVKKGSGGKSEGRHRESSSRKEGRESGADRERERERDRERDREKEKEREKEKKGKEGKSEKIVDGEESRSAKPASEKTDLNVKDQLLSPESDSRVDRRLRRKRDGSDSDKPIDIVGDIDDRRMSSREEAAKDGRSKDEKHKDERHRDKYREEADRESRHRDDRKKEEHAVRDHINNKSDDKHLRDERESAEIRQKKSKPQDGNWDRDHDCSRDFGQEHDHDRDHDRSRERARDKERERDHFYDRDQDWDQDCERDHDRDWDYDHDRDRNLDRDRDCDQDGEHVRDRGRDRIVENDSAFVDDRSTRKEGRGKKRSPDDFDDYSGSKSRRSKITYHDMEKRSVSTSRGELDADRGRSQSTQAAVDNNANSSKRRTSPSSSSLGAQDEYRHFKIEESKYRDAVMEQRTKVSSSREVTSLLGSSERVPKYRSSEKPVKMDDGHVRELSQERLSSSKASPMGLVDKSPSLSLDRRYSNRSIGRRSLEIEESGRRGASSTGGRDFPSGDDRANWDLSLEKPLVDDLTSVDSPFHNRGSQSHPAIIPPPAFRGGAGSLSFMSAVEDDSRPNSGGRHRRSSDHSRGQGNSWRGHPTPNWSSPVPNGFMPFQHGPPHGGFQAMMPQFPSLFGVRPSIEINHSGIPYHIPDADRFSGHFRPLGWQNMMDGSGPSHLHGWDGNNGVFRDEMHLFGAPEWDQKRHPMNGRGWESSADMWKGQNGDLNMGLPPASMKEEVPAQTLAEDVAKSGQASRSMHNDLKENNQLAVEAKDTEKRLAIPVAIKESTTSSPKTTYETATNPPKISNDNDVTHFCRAYLSKMDISTELASPELYSQCMSLLDMEISAIVDEDSIYMVNLKDGTTVAPKGSVTSLSSALFPVSSGSVFQRAMDIYKKQSVCLNALTIANGVKAEINSTSKVEEQVSINDGGGADEPFLQSEVEMPDVPISNLDDKKECPVIDVTQEEPEGMIAASTHEGDGNGHAPCLKLESLDESFSHNVAKNSVVIVNGSDLEEMKLELVNADDAEGEGVINPGNVSHPAITSKVDTHFDENVKIGINVSACAEEGGQDPLVFAVGSLKASGDLMPELNDESESVILSRIHHSPESTH